MLICSSMPNSELFETGKRYGVIMNNVAIHVENEGKPASLKQLLWRYVKAGLKAIIPHPYRMQIQSFLRPVIAVTYVGLRYKCPCCGWRLRKLKPFRSHILRKNARCPRCLSMERHRLLWLYLHNRTRIFSEQTHLLHVAPEPILQKRFRSSPNINYTTADLNSPLASVRIDLTMIPCRDESFDTILCSHVLEHIEDDRAAMRELYRVLRPGGWAILQVPLEAEREVTYEDFSITSPEGRFRHFNQSDHVRIYGRDYKDRLEAVSFIVTVDDYVKTLGQQKIQTYCLDPNEGIYLCTKPIADVV